MFHRSILGDKDHFVRSSFAYISDESQRANLNPKSLYLA